jgi:hypothetical protein
MNLFKKTKELKSKTKGELAKELDGMINQAHMQGSDLLGRMMLMNLTFKIESSQKYANSEEQVDSFLDKYPSMTVYRDKIVEKARKFRKENGLGEVYAQEKL